MGRETAMFGILESCECPIDICISRVLDEIGCEMSPAHLKSDCYQKGRIAFNLLNKFTNLRGEIKYYILGIIQRVI